jgi:chromate transport protein ChrA
MNSDIKELVETCIVLFLVTLFAVCCMFCVKWGVPYQTLIVFAGFIGTLLGILGMKMRAGGNTQPPQKPSDPQAISPNA